MRLNIKLLSTVMFLVVSGTSYADNCDKTRNTYDDIYCTNKIFASADDDLNQNYQKLRTQLNQSQKQILKKSQLAWIRERDEQCVEDQRVDVGCRLEKTQQRNQWLVERLRECKTVGCKTSQLSN